MKKVYVLAISLLMCTLAQLSYGQTTFNYTGSVQTFNVPLGVTMLGVDATGGAGGNAYDCCTTQPNPKGGRVQCTLNVTPGSTYYIYVGGAGANWSSSINATGGYNGGGGGGSFAAPGGGASDVRTSASGTAYTGRLVVAGGAGGGGDFDEAGGVGGGLTGASGTGGACGGGPTGPSCTTGYVLGAFGAGGFGNIYSCGGGGGGWYGGNCGVYLDGGGGGGSSYTDPTLCSGVTHTQGYSAATGNGHVILTILCNSPGTITGTMAICQGSTSTLTDPTSITGGVWSSSNTAIATIGSSSGVVTAVSPGTATITYTVSNPCGALATAVVTVNPLPGAIAGSGSVCIGSSTTLTSSTSGGTWTSSNPTLATIGTVSGVVTGIASGNPVITYTLPTLCSAAFPMTVNTAPSAITGVTTVCPGYTTTLSSTPTGGTWTSSNTSLATVAGGTGVVTGVSGGSLSISYTALTGCTTSIPYTVISMSPIVGVLGMCSLSTTTTLTDATPGGTWSSTNTAVATIGSGTGVLTSVGFGISTISYTAGSCTATAVEDIAPTSGSLYSMTGGGSYCSGGTGLTVGLSGSTSGVSYQLFNGTGPVGPPVSGAGFSFNFPGTYTAGTYYVVADYGSSCAQTMSGSAIVTANPLPTAFTVSGGGTYCGGGAGLHIYLNSSTIGVNYQLYVGSAPVGAPISGTSAVLDFGLQTATGVYSIVGTNATTGCVANMSNTITITTSPLPTSYTLSITGGGGYCAGGTGDTIKLSNSTSGVNYTLYYGGTTTGITVAGTGSAISFGLQTAAGVYTVIATNTSTSCSNSMLNSVTLAVNPLPTVFTVTGGGSYCSGTTGVHIGLNSSTIGVSYQLYNGVTLVGTAYPGSGAALDFGTFTTAGSYTVIATNPTTGCTMNMSGSAVITITPLPTSFSITGGGAYCAGGTGMPVGLSGSVTGTSYSLYNGSSLTGGASGTGAALSFGSETAAGTYSVIATSTITGCSNNMSGTVSIVINPLPPVFNVSGGGAYCAGGTGVHVGLTGSTSGINYQLFVGGITTGAPVSGTGASIDFGLQTTAGSYTVVATNATTGCTSIMTGSVAVSINPLPTVYAVTGGNPYCTGGAGSVIGLAGSNTGISYQLYNGTATVGAPQAGTGSALTFGLQTLPGTYTIVASNISTGCIVTMSGSPVISILPLPTAYTVTPNTGSYCAGGTGVHVILSNSNSGIIYQLYNGTTPVGTAAAGSGFPLDFGPQTAAGTYVVIATNTTTTCANNMSGSSVITINPLPTPYPVTGGGNYCAGGTGLHIGLLASTVGVNYQLYNGPATVGAPIAGTGAALDFGLQTAAGTYLIVATNTVTGCTNNMTGTVVIAINPLPALHTLTGGGNYCFGTSGSSVGLNGSDLGINYQLFNGGAVVGAPMAGTGSAISFGLQTTTGTYTIVATNTVTGCTVNMIGSTSININPLPNLHNVTGGGNYCPGGTGVHVGLNTSDAGINYQLMKGTSTVGSPVAGTGLVLDFGLQTATGVYTVVATNAVTGCTSTMTGSVTIGLSALPVVYNVTGGGNYCPSGAGMHIGLSGSNLGVTYQLFIGSSPVPGATMAGTGLPLDFGLMTATGIYTIVATGSTTGCTSNMNGSATIGISPLPGAHSVTGGGNYCPAGTGVVIGLNGSDLGVNYQLFNGSLLVGTGVSGTGSPLNFGLFTTPGTYTIVASGATTGCTNPMTGSATIGLYPLPAAFTVTGGGNYCAGGTGVHITLSGSATGDNYQLFNGSTPVGGLVAGTGSVLDLGVITGTGTYTVVASDAVTGCTNNMTGSVVVGVYPLPVPYAVTGGGAFCSGGPGLHVLLSGSNTGVVYQLFNSAGPVGSALPGTGFGLDFGLQTVLGDYYVVATSVSTGCTNNMTGTVIIAASPLPTIYTVSSSSSNYCAGGPGVDITLSGSSAGVTYQLYRGGAPVGSALAGTGSPLNFGYNTLAGTYTVVALNTATSCTQNMASSITVVINALPAAYTITGGGNYCAGGTGVNVGLSGSATGVLYQLYVGSITAGTPIAGTGGAISFGPQTTAGIYHIIATNPASGCTNMMSGTITIGVNALPTPYNVSGGGSYCAGGTGADISLTSSNTGINYQLFNGSSPVGSMIGGTGGSLDFGMQLTPGTYTVAATNSTSTCSNNMSGSASITVNPAPTSFNVIGGGNYCQGGAGVHVGLNNSTTGVTYQLFNGSTPVGSSVSGSGSVLDFGYQTASGTYTVVALNSATGCSGSMSGSVNVGINPLPTVFNVTGGGNYCASGSGVLISLNGSAIGVNYQLYNGITAIGSAVAGTGGILSMGMQTASGTYTVVATNATTGCSSTMAGSATISITPLVTPAVSLNTTAGDSLCSGIYTTFTATPVNGGGSPTYVWTINSVMVAGVGNTYSYLPVNGDVIAVVMTSDATCTSSPSATNHLNLNVLEQGTPSVNIAAIPGNEVCTGTSVTFNSSTTYGGTAPTYSWFKNGMNVGSAASFTYVPVNSDVIYCAITSNYHCRNANSATSPSITMIVDVNTTPVVSVSANPTGNYYAGETVTFTAAYSNAGTGPTFQWFVNGVPVSGANSSVFVTSNLNTADVVSCQVTSGGGCAGNVGSGQVTVHVIGVGVQPVTVSGTDITVVPNPNKGNFTVKGNLGTLTDETVTVEITNVLGQVIYTNKVIAHNGELNEQIQLNSNPANGMYLLSVRTASDTKVFHMVIEQ